MPVRHVLVAAAWLTLSWASAGQAREWHAVRSWVYQLCNYQHGRLDAIAESGFDLAVIDLSRDGGSDYFTRGEIEAVKKTDKIVLAYFEIGAIEEYRPEWNSVPGDLKAGNVAGWPEEQYVKYWDERWWPVVQGRIDQALASGFDGAYLDMVTAYEEIPGTGKGTEERAHLMVDLIARVSGYAKGRKADFKIVPQNCPELYTWSYWEPKPNEKYIHAIDGLGLESVFYIAHDKPARKRWCRENRANAVAIRKAGKLVLGVDYAKKPASIAEAYRKQTALGFVPYVTVEALDRIQRRVESNQAVPADP
jgi:cysteinyl-tRNA synthetase